MLSTCKRALQRWLRSRGYELRRTGPTPDYEPDFLPLYRACKPYTMTSAERMYGLYRAVRYLEQAGIAGDCVECGVWRGGSSMMTAKTLLAAGRTQRTLHLFDTYAGMSEPTEHDKKFSEKQSAFAKWRSLRKNDHVDWCYAPIEDVQQNMIGTGYPADRLRFVKGKVEDTLPAHAPEKIALLRIDTDWYESTKHCLEHLFPRLQPGGILLLDDYGAWQGAKEAADAYLVTQAPLLLSRLDEAGYIGVKAQ